MLPGGITAGYCLSSSFLDESHQRADGNPDGPTEADGLKVASGHDPTDGALVYREKVRGFPNRVQETGCRTGEELSCHDYIVGRDRIAHRRWEGCAARNSVRDALFLRSRSAPCVDGSCEKVFHVLRGRLLAENVRRQMCNEFKSV